MSENIYATINLKCDGKEFSAHVDIPPEKQDTGYIRKQFEGMAGAAARKVKELRFSPK